MPDKYGDEYGDEYGDPYGDESGYAGYDRAGYDDETEDEDDQMKLTREIDLLFETLRAKLTEWGLYLENGLVCEHEYIPEKETRESDDPAVQQ